MGSSAKMVTLMGLAVTLLTAQSPSAKFEVASIKAVALGSGHVGMKINAARVDIAYWSVRQLILRAYEIPSYRLDGPEWLNDIRFDIAAKIPEGVRKSQLPGMLQALLAERFGLRIHREDRQVRGYV